MEGNGERPALILSILSFLPSREQQERGIKRERKKKETLKNKWPKS